MTNSYPFVVFGDEFKGKRVLVTGGKKGVGEAIVRRFELSGASVATTARSAPPPGLAPAVFIPADLGTARGVQNVVDRIQQEWGGLDVFMNNVGGTETRPGGFEVLSDEDWQRILEVNLLLRYADANVPIQKGYHTWLILEKGDGCLVVTEETQNGPSAIAFNLDQPTAMYDAHHWWLAALKVRSEGAAEK